MAERSWWGRQVMAALVGLGLVAVTTTALAADPIPGGTFELGLAGGYSFSHNIYGKKRLDVIHGYDALPHLGWVVTDEHGQRLYRGNLELLVEPTYIHLADRPTADLYGGSGLARWLLTGNGTLRPYLEAGGGVLYGKTNIRETTCEYNFLIEGGAGVQIFTSENVALNLGYRFQHISNGGRCTPNLGLNSSLFIIGVNYYFR